MARSPMATDLTMVTRVGITEISETGGIIAASDRFNWFEYPNREKNK